MRAPYIARPPARNETIGVTLTPVSGPISPDVAFGVTRAGSALEVTISVSPLASGLPARRVTLGVAASKVVRLESDAAKATPGEGAARYIWHIPAEGLIATPGDWDRLRLAFAVRWPGTDGADVQRSSSRCTDGRAPHAGLPEEPAAWAPLSIAEYEAQLAERRLEIGFDFYQPMDGKLTVAIDAADGRRVRNLICGQVAPHGPRHVAWDGLDDNGKVVGPGDYRWRSISHPGITPHYLFSFYNNGKPPWRNGTPGAIWLADHSDPIAAAAFGNRVVLAAPIAESGNTIMEVNEQGVKTAARTCRPPSDGALSSSPPMSNISTP